MGCVVGRLPQARGSSPALPSQPESSCARAPRSRLPDRLSSLRPQSPVGRRLPNITEAVRQGLVTPFAASRELLSLLHLRQKEVRLGVTDLLEE